MADGGRRRAVVIGGGIGGLTAAAGLLGAGWEVSVLERAGTVAALGAGLTLFPNAMAALDALGLADPVRAVGATPRPAEGLRDPSGRWVVRAGGQTPIEEIFAVHRADLHRVLLGALPAGAVRTGTEATSVRSLPEAAVVEALGPGGEPVRLQADLVVAADGLGSTVRGQCWPEHPGPSYAGYTAWRGVTATPVPLGEGGGETWGRGERFGMLPLGDGRVYWYATASTTAGVRYADEHAEVARRFAAWHAPIPALLAATVPETVLHHDIWALREPLTSYVSGRVVLLGDAAHAMTPDLGQGACQAIEDAAVLAAEASGVTAGTADLPGALAAYDAQRRPRTQRVVRTAWRMSRLAQARGPVSSRARTLLMRLTPPGANLRMVTSVTSWRPPPGR